MKRVLRHIGVWVLLIALLAAPMGAMAEVAGAPDMKTDFYAAINADWLAEAKIAPDRFMVGGFADLSFEMPDLLMADSDKMLTGEIQPGSELLRQYAAFYALCADYEQRNADGMAPIKPYLERMEALDSLEALNADLPDWLLTGMPLPFSLAVWADLGDAQRHALYASAPSLLLPDVSYYDAANPYGPMLLQAMADASKQLLLEAGYSEQDAARISQEAIAFDALLVPYAKTAEENSEVKNLYNPESLSDFCAAHEGIGFKPLIESLVSVAPEQLIVTDVKFFGAFDQIVCEQNFGLLKSWMTYQTLFACGGYLSESAQARVNSISDMLLGQAEPTRADRLAYGLASDLFGPVVGDYYGHTYFGEEAKADVIQMVKNMVEVYKSRLSGNTWLSEDTKRAALKKLDTMAIHVGYPDGIDPLYEQFIVVPASEGGTSLSNAMRFARFAMEDMFAKMGKPVNRDEWPLSAATVNAMYNPQFNAITFPAAILQAPFYSLNQSASANYGGIGATIAHEISHAFDPNGALFDEHGSMDNWWTDADKAQFEKLSEDMVSLFDGQPYAGATVNGKLTVTENVADAGGLACALEVAQSLPDADLNAFFTNYATIWRAVYTPEVEQYLLASDVHAPNKLRVNLQLPLLQAFYDTYGIDEADGMYIAPERRVAIW